MPRFARLPVITCALVAVPALASAQRLLGPAMDTLLDRMVGRWEMTGTVRGRPAHYTLDASRVLQGRFVELHMTDVVRPPAYEARVFIGVDSAKSRYLVHWMDNFGAAYSVPAAEGWATRDTIRFEFAYADGPFRDTFTFNRRDGTWRFLLEGQDSARVWRTFADYRVHPR